jgi:large subunit ribosomal protein L32e
MSSKKELIELRKKIKSKKPNFVRQDVNKLPRLKNKSKWRKPKGYHSKLKARKNQRKLVSPGYGSPKQVKGVHKSGLKPVLIDNKKELSEINNKEQGIIISGRLNIMNKLDIVKQAIEKKINILNIKQPEKFVKETEEKFKKREQKKKKIKEKKKKKITKKEKQQESIEDKLTEEEKKKLEKQEIDRLLTKKF